MAGDAVKILIQAEDQASAKAVYAAKNIENAVSGVKEVGSKAKASTEFIGVLAMQLGGTEFASAAQGVAGVTEKIGQFSEVMKLGGAGAAAFKAGLGALVGVMSFQLGKSIGEMIFGVDDVAGRMKQAASDADEFANRMIRLSGVKFGENLQDLELIRDPDKQQEAARALFFDIDKQVNDAVASFQYYNKEADKALAAKQGPEVVADLQNEAAGYIKLAESLRQQQSQLSQKYSAHAQQVRLIKEQQAAEDEAAAKKAQIDQSTLSTLRNINYQYIELTKGAEEARRTQLKDQGLGDTDIKRIMFAEKMLKTEQDAEAAKKKAQDEEKSRLQRIADLGKSELQRLEEQKILLEQGEQAAEAFRLQQQGLDKDIAMAIAAAKAQFAEAAKSKEIKATISTPDLAARESRLLSRGKADDSQKKIEANTLATVGRLDKVADAITALKEKLQPPTTIIEFQSPGV
jgi:hypothetical protein